MQDEQPFFLGLLLGLVIMGLVWVTYGLEQSDYCQTTMETPK